MYIRDMEKIEILPNLQFRSILRWVSMTSKWKTIICPCGYRIIQHLLTPCTAVTLSSLRTSLLSWATLVPPSRTPCTPVARHSTLPPHNFAWLLTLSCPRSRGDPWWRACTCCLECQDIPKIVGT